MRNRTLRAFVRSALFLAGLGSLACAGGSPTSPSALSPAGSAATGVTIRGQLDGAGAAASGQVTALSERANIRISVSGTSLSTLSDASGRFVLSGVPAGRVELRFEGPGIDARLEISGLQEGQELSITVRINGSQVVLVNGPSPSPSPGASPAPSPSPGHENDEDEDEDENEDEDEDENEVEFTGAIQSLTAPNLVVSGRSVSTNASTRFLDNRGRSISFSDLRVGDRVEVEGRLQGSTIAATKIKKEDQPAPSPAPSASPTASPAPSPSPGQGQGEVEFKGRIESLASPNLVVAGRQVSTNAGTRILDDRGRSISFSDLRVGDRVEVEGRLQGSLVAATKIKKDDD